MDGLTGRIVRRALQTRQKSVAQVLTMPGWRARAIASSWKLGPGDRRLLRTIDRLLGLIEHPRVVVVTDTTDDRLALVSEDCPVVAADTPSGSLHVQLSLGGKYDLIIVDVADPAVRARMITDLLFHAKVGGKLLVSRLCDGVKTPGESVVRRLCEIVDPAADLEADAWHLQGKDLAALRKAMRRVELLGNHAVISNGTLAYAKLDEAEVNELLERTGDRRGRIITSIPGGSFQSSARLRESPSPYGGFYAKEYDVPEVFLRAYEGVLCVPGQVAVQGDQILPDTFRHIGKPRIGNRYAPDVAPRFSVLKDRRLPDRTLAGSHFYWDSEFRGHFGHAMTEQLSRLWAFRRAKDEYPDLKVVMAINKTRELARFEVDILSRFGAGEDDLVFEYEPVFVERLVAATPMFSQPTYVHPGITEVWDHLSDSLAAEAPDRPYPERFFVARRLEKRGCRNSAEVEALFREKGFEIIYPEDYGLPEQARLFREAKVIGGYAGSGLFNALLAAEPKHLIIVTSESYTAQNEWMIAAVRGHQIDVAWCEAEVKMPKGWHWEKAFQSPYTFNPQREGVFLRNVLAAL